MKIKLKGEKQFPNKVQGIVIVVATKEAEEIKDIGELIIGKLKRLREDGYFHRSDMFPYFGSKTPFLSPKIYYASFKGDEKTLQEDIAFAESALRTAIKAAGLDEEVTVDGFICGKYRLYRT